LKHFGSCQQALGRFGPVDTRRAAGSLKKQILRNFVQTSGRNLPLNQGLCKTPHLAQIPGKRKSTLPFQPPQLWEFEDFDPEATVPVDDKIV